MKVYPTQSIRNVVLLGNTKSGKTTLAETMLFEGKVIDRRGSVEAKTTVSDNTEIEQIYQRSIYPSLLYTEFMDNKLNIIDTPGHSDFGGEVERVLNMADGCLLLVDAKEGPMPQTRFVLKKALEMGHKIIVVINKIDKEGSRPDFALEATMELFLELGGHDQSLSFPVIYA